MGETKRFSMRYFLAGLVWLGYATAIWPQAAGRVDSTCCTSVSQFKLILPGVGWIVVDQLTSPSSAEADCHAQHLYWTENNGQSWRDITPFPMPTRSMGKVFFLDRQHAWILSSDALSEEPNASFYLSATEDSGKNWRTVVLHRSTFKLMDDYTFPSQLFFFDAQHGWMLWRWAMMNSRLDYLLGTTDGGRTWKRLPDPPGAGPLQFISPKVGWMIGGPPTSDGIPVPESLNLWTTHDGGLHWSTVPVAFPEDEESGAKYFSGLWSRNSQQGVAVAQSRISDYVFRFFTCVTRDGGRSWSFSRFDAYHATPSLIGEQVVWSISDWPAMKVSLRRDDSITSPTPPSGLSPGGRFSDFDFVDDSNGWALYDRELLSTSDGGKTLHLITPSELARSPFPPPQLFALNGLMLRFPPTPLMPQGFRAPAQPPGAARRPLGPAAGGPLQIAGAGLLFENTVWIGTRQVKGSSEDGKRLVVSVPSDVPPGTYDICVENAHGKTEAVQVTIRPAESLRISGVYNQDERFRDRPYRVDSSMNHGQKVILPGSGFSLENTVWFGTVPAQTHLVISGGAALQFAVPESLAPGKYELYVTNANGKSNILNVVVLE